MYKFTGQINKIIDGTDVRKWELAQRLSLNPNYLSAKLRDGLSNRQETKRYFKALKSLIKDKQHNNANALQAIEHSLDDIESAEQKAISEANTNQAQEAN